MSYNPEEILSLAESFEEFIKNAKAKKLDPKAKVRSRGTVIFPAESPKVKDKKDHFPINNAAQARNALARANQFSKASEWYKGSLQSLVSTVAKAVKKHYPSISVSEAAKKPGKNSKASNSEIVGLYSAAEKAKKHKKTMSELERLEDMLHTANRTGDLEEARDIKKQIDELKSSMPHK